MARKEAVLLDSKRLKNIIILILLLVNGFLLGSLAMRKTAEQESFRRTAEQLAALFEADGMSLDIYAISRDTPPSGVSLTRDATLEGSAAAFLLGEDGEAADQGGGLFQYQGGAGQVLFRSSGAFEAVGLLAPAEDVEDFCRDFCRKFLYGEPEFQLDEAGNGSASAVCLYNGLPVFNCMLSFTMKEGAVTAAAGVLLPGSGTPVSTESPPLSAAGALSAFQQMRRENTAVASSVTGTQLCYELQTTGTSMTLTPAWKITADTADYYVNCYTGSVAAG